MKEHSLLSKVTKAICLIAMTAIVIVSIAVYHASLVGLIIFFAFLAFYIMLPGALMIKIAQFKTDHFSAEVLVAFFLGWCLIVIEYFLTQLIGSTVLLYSAGPICSATYIYLIASRLKSISVDKTQFLRTADSHAARLVYKVSFDSIPSTFFIFIALLMIYVFMFTQFQYMSPDRSSSVYVSLDKAYQMSLIGSLSHGYPLADPLVAGRVVHYHIFSQILLAVPVMLFNLSPDFMVMSCTPYLTVATMGLSLYAMFRHFCRNKERAGLYSLSFILANVFIGRSISSSYMFRMLLINENYAGFSAACIVVCVIILDVYFKSTRSPEKTASLIILTLLTMLLTGIKAPLGLVLVGGLIGTFLLGLLLRKASFNDAILPVILPTSGFFLIYQALLSLNGTNGVGGDSIISLGKIVGVCFWKSDLTAVLKAAGMPTALSLIIVFLTFVIVFFTAYTIPFVIGYIRELILVIFNKKNFDFAKVTVYASAFVGFIAMMLLRYTGHSQVYFGAPTLMFAPLIVFWYFEDLRDKQEPKRHIGRIFFSISRAWFFAVLILTSATLAMCFTDTMPAVIKHADPSSTYSKYKSLSADEYRAMMWIKYNTPEDALIATQMYKSTGSKDYSVVNRWQHCHFLYAAYSVRNYYLEGSGYTFTDVEVEERREMIKSNDRLFDPTNDERGNDARELGVDYVIVTQRIYPTQDLSSSDYEKVFANDDVDIYKIKS